MTQLGAADLEALWPQLETHFPNLRETAPRMVLNHFRMPGGNYCWSWAKDETRKKLLFLTSLGITSPVKGINRRDIARSLGMLSTHFEQEVKSEKDAGFLVAMKPFLPDATKTDSISSPRLVKAEPKCSFTLTDGWYRELIRNATVSEKIPVETVQLIDIPGEAGCGLLLGGVLWPSSPSSDLFSGPWEGPTSSCPEPLSGYEIAHNQQGRIERLRAEMEDSDSDSAVALTPVFDTMTGRSYYLRDEGGGVGRCYGGYVRRKLPGLYAWKESSKGLFLGKVTDWELEKVLFDQCRLSNNDYDIFCDGIWDINEADTNETDIGEANANDMYRARDYQNFLKTFGAARYDAYQVAILALDKPKLRSMQRIGIPGSWTAEAITRVGQADDLSLAEKRKRTAWIFYDHEQLARSLRDDVLTGLLDWLPREDWKPVLGIIDRHRLDVRDLAAAARQKELHRLACDLDHAQGLICGGSWSVDGY